MDSYIVRIYRYSGEEHREITGLVEEVATQAKIPFHSSSELLKILTDKNQRQSEGVAYVSPGQRPELGQSIDSLSPEWAK